MGSDLAMNPPRPIWEEHKFSTWEDAIACVGVAWDNKWKAQTWKSGSTYHVSIHRGEYI